MAPSAQEDPVIAEYDVFLTPQQEQQILLLQYINQPRDRPYTTQKLRVKPKSGFVEMDVNLHQASHFNKYQGLKWGDALKTAKTLQNESSTYGPASGFAMPRIRPNRAQLKDPSDRETQIWSDMADMDNAREEGRLLNAQTLGGKMMKTDGLYFVGAFRGKELHLSQVNDTVQMRPQFHHIDAEAQRERVASSRATVAETETRPAPARALQQSYKDLNDDKDKDAPERKMRQLLSQAEEEEWDDLQYIDETEDLAFDAFNRCLFVEQAEVKSLKSTLDAEKYLDEINLPRHDSHRRKKRPPKRKEVELDDSE